MRKSLSFIALGAISFFLMFFQHSELEKEVKVFSSFYPETVIVDAGHGGEDSGAVGGQTYFEKNINLDVSKKLELILNLHGINTDMTRRADVSLGDGISESLRKRKFADLEKSVEKVLANSNAILISVHQNSFPQDARCIGAQVFYSENNIRSALSLSHRFHKTVLYISVSFAISYTGLLLPSF